MTPAVLAEHVVRAALSRVPDAASHYGYLHPRARKEVAAIAGVLDDPDALEALRDHLGEPERYWRDALRPARYAFDPEQPRADDGKWTAGGGRPSHSAETTAEAKEFHAKAAKHKTAAIAADVSESVERSALGGRDSKTVKALIRAGTKGLEAELSGAAARAADDLARATGKGRERLAKLLHSVARRMASELGAALRARWSYQFADVRDELRHGTKEGAKKSAAKARLTRNDLVNAFNNAMLDGPLLSDGYGNPLPAEREKAILDAVEPHFLGAVRSPALRDAHSHSPDFVGRGSIGYPEAWDVGKEPLHYRRRPERYEFREQDHPRGNPGNRGQFRPKDSAPPSGKNDPPESAPAASSGEGSPRKPAEAPSGEKPSRKAQPKELRAARRYRDVARRRRVIRAVRNEGKLADAVDGWNLEDSEPADVVRIEDATGKPLRTREAVKTALRWRELATETLKDRNASEERKDGARRVLSCACEFYEVKSLLTAARNSVSIGAKPLKRKQRWERKYGAAFSVVVIDDRRGAKHSGHKVYVARGELAKTFRLDTMQKASDFAAVREGQ